MQRQEEVATSNKKGPINQWQNGAVAVMNNQTQSTLSLDRFKNWAGVPSTGSFPQNIGPNSSAHFTHLRGGQYGSIAGVQYSGINACGVQCAWILAWEAPVQDSPPCPPNRVYVTCGPKTTMDALTWDQIITELDNSLTYDTATDSATKTSANGSIQDLTPDTATLSANFSLLR
ncbi:hypothetical protein RND81_05G110200 [Saponaria officinalis]|uniref:Uncharacterized protein n=1 Tax=Saponaria officinalis TaxID=3572 RepID=A0AAW1KRX2_SAPOF